MDDGFRGYLFEKEVSVRAAKSYLSQILSGVVGVIEGRFTAQKKKFSITDFFSKCEQICRKMRIWLHLLKKSVMKNFRFFAQWLIHFDILQLPCWTIERLFLRKVLSTTQLVCVGQQYQSFMKNLMTCPWVNIVYSYLFNGRNIKF